MGIEIKLTVILTQDRPKLIFESDGNFSLGGDFTDNYKCRKFDSLNFESFGMLADGLLVQITSTSSKVAQFKAMPSAEMGAEDEAITELGGIPITGANQEEWNTQLYNFINDSLNW